MQQNKNLGYPCKIDLIQWTQLALTDLCQCTVHVRMCGKQSWRTLVCMSETWLPACERKFVCVHLSLWTNSLTCDVLILSLCKPSLRALLSEASQAARIHSHISHGQVFRSLTSKEDCTSGCLNACPPLSHHGNEGFPSLSVLHEHESMCEWKKQRAKKVEWRQRHKSLRMSSICSSVICLILQIIPFSVDDSRFSGTWLAELLTVMMNPAGHKLPQSQLWCS